MLCVCSAAVRIGMIDAANMKRQTVSLKSTWLAGRASATWLDLQVFGSPRQNFFGSASTRIGEIV